MAKCTFIFDIGIFDFSFSFFTVSFFFELHLRTLVFISSELFEVDFVLSVRLEVAFGLSELLEVVSSVLLEEEGTAGKVVELVEVSRGAMSPSTSDSSDIQHLQQHHLLKLHAAYQERFELFRAFFWQERLHFLDQNVSH